ARTCCSRSSAGSAATARPGIPPSRWPPAATPSPGLAEWDELSSAFLFLSFLTRLLFRHRSQGGVDGRSIFGEVPASVNHRDHFLRAAIQCGRDCERRGTTNGWRWVAVSAAEIVATTGDRFRSHIKYETAANNPATEVTTICVFLSVAPHNSTCN